MGVLVEAHTYTYGDNMSVVTNASQPASVLRKKSNSIYYHAVCESVAMGESLLTNVRTENNLADFLTKVFYGTKRRKVEFSTISMTITMNSSLSFHG